jgi:hypothetical protein
MLMVVVSMGISVSLVVGCGGCDVSMETSCLELDYGSKGVLDESTMVEIEYQVRDFMWHCIQRFAVNHYGASHDRKEYTALTTWTQKGSGKMHIGCFERCK